MAVFTLIGAAAGAALGAAVGGALGVTATIAGIGAATVVGGAIGAAAGYATSRAIKKAQTAAQTATTKADEQIDIITGKSEDIINVTNQVTGLQTDQIAVQKEIAEDRQEQERLAVRRQRRQSIREAQIIRARQKNVAQGMGAVGSAVSGGAASIGSQLSAALGYSTQQSGLSEEILQGQQKGMDLQSEINTLYGKANVLQTEANIAATKAGMFSSRAGMYTQQASSYMGLFTNFANIGAGMIPYI